MRDWLHSLTKTTENIHKKVSNFENVFGESKAPRKLSTIRDTKREGKTVSTGAMLIAPTAGTEAETIDCRSSSQTVVTK